MHTLGNTAFNDKKINLFDSIFIIYFVSKQGWITERAHDESLQQVIGLLLVLRRKIKVGVGVVVGGSKQSSACRIVGCVAGVEAERACS